MIYSEQERQVYRCPVTGRYLDPLAARRSMFAAAKGRGGFNGAVADARSPDEGVRAAGEERLVAAGRAALGLPPIDPKTGEGVTDAVAMEALTAFTRWLSGKGGTARGGPSGAPCTDCPQGR